MFIYLPINFYFYVGPTIYVNLMIPSLFKASFLILLFFLTLLTMYITSAKGILALLDETDLDLKVSKVHFHFSSFL